MELEPFVFSHTGALVGTRDIHRDNSDDETLAAINRLALRPLQLEEVAVFTLDLCNNQVDRHFSRFPEEELERINQLTPGRPLMERHDLRGTLPRGTFFRSHLHRNGDHISVRPEVYVLRAADNHDFILNIEGGVYRETSIGFSFRTPECAVCGQDLRTCAHVPKSYIKPATLSCRMCCKSLKLKWSRLVPRPYACGAAPRSNQRKWVQARRRSCLTLLCQSPFLHHTRSAGTSPRTLYQPIERPGISGRRIKTKVISGYRHVRSYLTTLNASPHFYLYPLSLNDQRRTTHEQQRLRQPLCLERAAQVGPATLPLPCMKSRNGWRQTDPHGASVLVANLAVW